MKNTNSQKGQNEFMKSVNKINKKLLFFFQQVFQF